MPLHDTGRSGGSPTLTASSAVFPVGLAPGAAIAMLNDPYAGLGLGATSYAGFGAVPAQLRLSDGAIVAGSGTAVAGAVYALGVQATSGDGKRAVGETIVLTAQAAASGAPSSATYLPSVAIAPIAVWSPYALVSGYTGPTLHAVAAGDIAATSDGSPATAGIGAAGDAVDIVYDQTGGGRHLIQADAGARPTLAPLARQGAQPISFTSGASMRMPDAIAADNRNVTLFDVYGYNSLQSGSPGRLGEAQDAGGTVQFVGSVANGGAPCAGGAAVAVGARALMMQPQVVTYRGAPGAARIGCDGVFGGPAAPPSATSFAGGHVGKGAGGGDGGLHFLARVIYPVALSDADEASVRAALDTVFGTGGFGAAAAQIVVNGNSIEYGVGTSGLNGWVRQMIPMLKSSNVPVINLASGGLYLQAQSAFGPATDSLYRAGLTNLCVVIEPTNDIAFLMGQLDATAATFTADSSAGSAVLTNVSSHGGLVVGQSIRGGGSGAGGTALRTIAAIDTDSVTLSASAGATVIGGSYVAGARYAGTTTAGSAVVTALGGIAGLAVGQLVEAPGVPAGTTIAGVDGASQITLSAAATGSGVQTLVATDQAAAQAYAEELFATYTQPFVAARAARGFVVLVQTVLPRSWHVFSATRGQMDLARHYYNAKVASAAGGNYTMLDRGGLAGLADPLDAARYSGDGAHPNDAGAALIARYAAQVIDMLLP